jgi:hypothetical protein
VLESAGQLDESRDALTRVIVMLEGTPNQHDPLTALARATRARIIHRRGDADAARGELAAALAAVRGRMEPEANAVRRIALEFGIAVTAQRLLGEE